MSRLIFDADTLGGTTTLSSADAVGNFTITVPAVNGTMSVKDASGDATFRNITLTGAVLAGAWNGSTIAVAYGGTGATTLTGYVKGNGTSAMTASTTIPNTDITGLGTMSTQNANAVAISGGTISGLSAAIPVGSGGTGATTLTGYVKGNGAFVMTASSTIPNTDITGLGTMSTQGSDAVIITGGTANGLTIGAVNPSAGVFTTLRVNSTLSLAGTTGTSGQVLTSNGASAPTWQNIAGSGTVTSIDVSGGTTGLTTSGGPVTGAGTITLAGTLAIANGGTGATSAANALTALGAYPATNPSGFGVGTVTSVAGTGTVNGLTLTGTVTSSGSLTLGGTLSLAVAPAIGSTTPSTGAFTTLTASTSLIVADNVFTLQDNVDPTKQAQFELSGLTTATTFTYTLPNINTTLAGLSGTQTFTGSNTFSSTTLNFGSSVAPSTTQIAYGATSSGNTKTVNIGTGGLSGSTTAIAIGSSVSGATSTTLLNGTITTTAYTETIVASGTVGATATLAIAAGTILTATLTSATACTFTMPTATAGKSFTLLLKQPASGTPTTATFTGVKWNSGGAPTITATLGRLDIIAFVADGTNWYGTASQGYTY